MEKREVFKNIKRVVPDPTTEPEKPNVPDPPTPTTPPKEPTIPYLPPEKPVT